MESLRSSDGSDDASSPDPLALSKAIGAPPRWTTPRQRLGSMSPGVRKRELSFDTGTLRQPSPTKSIVLDTGPHPTTSPWRIKVTVQAEPRSGEGGEVYMEDSVKIKEPSTPSKRSPRKTRTTTVPLKDPDWTPKTPRGRGRPRKSTTPAPAKQKRKPTPARKKSDRPSTEELIVDGIGDIDQPLLAPNSPSLKRKRGRPPKTASALENVLGLSNESAGATGSQTHIPKSGMDLVDAGDVELPDLPEPHSDGDDDDGDDDDGDDATNEPAKISRKTSQSPRGQSLTNGGQQMSKSQSPAKKAQDRLSSPKISTRPGRSGWSRFSPLPPRHSFPSDVQSHASEASSKNDRTRSATENLEMPLLEEDENEEDHSDAARRENMIQAPSHNKQTPASYESSTSTSTSASEQSGDEEEDVEMPDNEPIGDETMMKSMDMTIVSPSSLYNKLDIHSSFMNSKTDDNEPSRQKPVIEVEDVMRRSQWNGQTAKGSPQDRVQALIAGSSPQSVPANSSSPHVHFSSPLHPSPRFFSSSDRPNSIHRRQQSTQSPQHKSSPISSTESKLQNQQSQSQQPQSQPPQNQMSSEEVMTPSVGRHLPTPESDERPSHEDNEPLDELDEVDDVENEVFDDVDMDDELDVDLKPETHEMAVDDSPVRTHSPDQRLDAASPSQPHSAISSLNQKRNEQWQREREEISRLANAAGSKTVAIESDHEEDDEEEDDDSDDEFDMWQEAGKPSSNSLKDSTNGSSVALYNEAQGKKPGAGPTSRVSGIGTRSSSDNPRNAAELPESSQSRVSGSSSELAGSSKHQDEIAALFKAASKSSMQPRTGLEVDDESTSAPQEELSSPISNEDTSHYLRRKVSSMLGGAGFFHDNETSLQSQVRNDQTTSVPLKSPGPSVSLSTSFLSPHVDRRLNALAYSPKRSSPLKRPLNIDDSSSGSSNNGGDISLASDAQQLQNEIQVSKRRASDSADSSSSRVLRPTAKRPKKSLLKVTQERRARALFGSSTLKPVSAESSLNSVTTSSANSLFEDEPSHQASSGTPSLLSQIWSYVPTFTFTRTSESMHTKPEASEPGAWPPVEPTHPLLKGTLLLPRVHPWTQNHYTSLRMLFNHWTRHMNDFDPLLPRNAVLLTYQWTKYIDVEISNWGYDCQITESLVVLAAIFAQLLVLDDTVEFEELYHDKMVMGDAARSTMHRSAITDWDVILRLFSVLVGHRVRQDETSGIPIDRTNDLKWKFKGGLFWRRKGMLWGLWD